MGRKKKEVETEELFIQEENSILDDLIVEEEVEEIIEEVIEEIEIDLSQLSKVQLRQYARTGKL